MPLNGPHGALPADEGWKKRRPPRRVNTGIENRRGDARAPAPARQKSKVIVSR